jgi:hypothetical protein
MTWHPKKRHLEEVMDHLAEVGPPQPDRPGGGAGRPPVVPNGPSFWKVLPPAMRINLNHSLGRFDQTAHVYPSGLYKQPPAPSRGIWKPEFAFTRSIHQVRDTTP